MRDSSHACRYKSPSGAEGETSVVMEAAEVAATGGVVGEASVAAANGRVAVGCARRRRRIRHTRACSLEACSQGYASTRR